MGPDRHNRRTDYYHPRWIWGREDKSDETPPVHVVKYPGLDTWTRPKPYLGLFKPCPLTSMSDRAGQPTLKLISTLNATTQHFSLLLDVTQMMGRIA
jgi:hypothetical protein